MFPTQFDDVFRRQRYAFFFYKTNKDTSKMTIFAEKIGELP